MAKVKIIKLHKSDAYYSNRELFEGKEMIKPFRKAWNFTFVNKSDKDAFTKVYIGCNREGVIFRNKVEFEYL